MIQTLKQLLLLSQLLYFCDLSSINVLNRTVIRYKEVNVFNVVFKAVCIIIIIIFIITITVTYLSAEFISINGFIH